MEYVSADVCDGRNKIVDERFARDKERIHKLENQQEQMLRLSIQMGEILKNQARQLENQSSRIELLERKPTVWLDRLQSGIVAAIISALVGLLMTRVF